MSGWLGMSASVFVPLLVAIDPIAITPFFMEATDGLTPQSRTRVLAHAMATAATITTLVLLHGSHGWGPAFAAFSVCPAITALTFAQSGRIVRIIGPAGARALGKVSSLILAAVGVRMVRVGLEAIHA